MVDWAFFMIFWTRGHSTIHPNFIGWWRDAFFGGTLDHLIGAVGTRKGVGFAFKHKTHTQYIAHRLAQGDIRLEVRIGIDVGMDFQRDVVLVEQVAKLVSNVNGFADLGDHAFAKRHLLFRTVMVNKHESAFFFAKENNDGRKLDDFGSHLRVCPDTDFELVPLARFFDDHLFDGRFNGEFYLVAVESSPIVVHNE